MRASVKRYFQLSTVKIPFLCFRVGIFSSWLFENKSKRRLVILALVAVVLYPFKAQAVENSILLSDNSHSPSQKKGFEIAARSDRSDRGYGDSKVHLTMILRNAAHQETRRALTIETLEVPSEQVGDKSLIIFTTPKDIAGTALLTHSKILNPDDQWLFLPASKRTKRIASNNKGGPFVGSEFAFEDFAAQELGKYSYDWLREEACGDRTCDVIQRTPLYEGSGYTYQIVWIDQTDFQNRKIEFYNRRKELSKTLTLSGYRSYQGILRPHQWEMMNHITRKSTELIFDNFEFKTGLTDNDFVKSRMARLR